MKVYIFGDSFSIYCRSGWIYDLSHRHSVLNYSREGYSNHDIFFSYWEHLDRIQSDDFVLLGWSDRDRPFKCHKPEVQEFQDKHFKHVHDAKFSKMQSILYMRYVRDSLEERELNHLIYWSFPSSYEGSTISWLDPSHSSLERFVYDVSFENELRPALIYFSKKELEPMTFDEARKVYSDDTRSNHIGSLGTHKILLDTVEQYIKKEVTGLKELI